MLDVKKTDNRILVEYASRSQDVLRLTYVLRDIILPKFNSLQWSEYGNGIFYKHLTANTAHNDELSPYMSWISVNVYMIPQDMDEEELAYIANKSLDSAFSYYLGTKFIELNVILHQGDDFSSIMQGELEHEVMHAYQYYKGGEKVLSSTIYSNAVSDDTIKGIGGLTNNQTDTVNIIKELPYLFDNAEISANIQRIWYELVRNEDIRKCKTYVYYHKAAFLYGKLRNLYTSNVNKEISKEFIDKMIVNIFEIPSSYYFKLLDKGVNKFNTKIGRVIAMHNERLN